MISARGAIRTHSFNELSSLPNSVGKECAFKRVKTPRQSNITRLSASKKDDSAPDLIEGLVGRLFGRKALEDSSPAGMKRLTVDDCPEMWGVAVDEFAAPLEGDPPDIAMLRPLLAQTQMEKVSLRLAYDADRDGWDAQSFHSRVDTFGATLIVATTVSGCICGGYNPRGFIGLGEDRDTIAAFLFTWPDGDTKKQPLKLAKVGGASLAVVDKPDVIQFGAEGLTLLSKGNERQAKSRLGSYYAKTPSGGRTVFGPNDDPKKTELKSLKAYVMVGEGETWRLDGVVWKTERMKQ